MPSADTYQSWMTAVPSKPFPFQAKGFRRTWQDVREDFKREGASEALQQCTAHFTPTVRQSEAIKRARPDVQGFLDHNKRFHELILDAADSRRLTSLLGSLIEQPVVWRTAQHYGREAFNRSHSEHEDLLAAFARRDGPWAEAIMAGHIRRAFHAYADAHHGLSAIDRGAA